VDALPTGRRLTAALPLAAPLAMSSDDIREDDIVLAILREQGW